MRESGGRGAKRSALPEAKRSVASAASEGGAERLSRAGSGGVERSEGASEASGCNGAERRPTIEGPYLVNVNYLTCLYFAHICSVLHFYFPMYSR